VVEDVASHALEEVLDAVLELGVVLAAVLELLDLLELLALAEF